MGNDEHGGGEVHVEQLGHDGRMLQYAVDESVDFCSCELLDGQADGVWCESASLDFGLDGILLDVDAFHGAVSCIACSTGDAVGKVYMGKGLQPGFAPPCFAEVS